MKKKPTNITELRDMVLDTFQDLKEGKIETSEALSISKLCDTVLGTIKTEIDYAKLTSQTPQISFMGQGTLLEHGDSKAGEQLKLTNPPQ
jgi:hypothetical protein